MKTVFAQVSLRFFIHVIVLMICSHIAFELKEDINKSIRKKSREEKAYKLHQTLNIHKIKGTRRRIKTKKYEEQQKQATNNK